MINNSSCHLSYTKLEKVFFFCLTSSSIKTEEVEASAVSAVLAMFFSDVSDIDLYVRRLKFSISIIDQ